MSLKRGSQGVAVVNLQKNMTQLGRKLTPDGDFGAITEAIVIQYQVDNKLKPDGIVGPVTQAKITKDLIAQATVSPAPVSPAPSAPSKDGVYPGEKFLLANLGRSENNKADVKYLVVDCKLWKCTKYCKDYSTIAGLQYAWCGAGRGTALSLEGYEIPDACEGASDWIGSGTKIDWKKDGIPRGANVVIRHESGGHHITGAARDHVAGEKVLVGLGCNQGDSINKSTYNVSGNAAGHDEIVWVGFPKKVA